MRSVLFLSAMFFAFQAFAETAPTTVFVTAQAQNPTNQRLVYELREQIRSSNGLAVADTGKDALIQISVLTLASGNKVIYSAVLTVGGTKPYSGMYLNDVLGECLPADFKGCTRNIVVGVDSVAANLRGLIRDAQQGHEPQSNNSFKPKPLRGSA